MSGTGDANAQTGDLDCTRSEVEEQLESILNSSQFRNSAVLQSFLRFITEQALENSGDNLSEYFIATQVFCRGPEFDSAEDTIVRTQAYRLRLKLNQYYNTDGIHDPIVIEVPKGHYVPSFRRQRQRIYTPAFTTLAEPDLRPTGERRRVSRLLNIVAIGLGALALFVLGAFVGMSEKPRVQPAANKPSAVDLFWSSFLGSERDPIVAYTNTLYFAADSGALLPFEGGPVADRGAMVTPGMESQIFANRVLFKSLGPLYFEDDMTGIGEVTAAVAVSKALERVGAHPSFKRCRLLTTYDLQNHDVIFLGSPFVNQILNELPGSPNFVFKTAASAPRLWNSRIENKQPQRGEMQKYEIERDPQSQVILADYAVISLLPGLAPGKNILVLAGLTTSGTEGAAEFATSMRGINEMAERLPQRGSPPLRSWPSFFEYLLKVRLSHGVDIIQSDTVASRTNKDRN
jgi:hypothetical protein